MESIQLFTTAYITYLKNSLSKDVIKYTLKSFDYDESQILHNSSVKTDYPELILPEKGNSHNLENSKIIFEGYKMSPVQATDSRIWTYLTHVTYWNYMRKREPVEEVLEEKRESYILNHWFIERIHPDILFRNNISLLWWVAYLTHDSSRPDPYELTREAFTQLDYTRLLAGPQGRNSNLVHALLEFVIENNEIFKNFKEPKVRYLMSKLNYVGGYKLIPNLEKEEIKKIFDSYKDELTKIQGR